MNKLLVIGANSFSGKKFIDYIYKNNFDKKYIVYGVGSKQQYTQHNILYKKIDVTSYEDINNYLLECNPQYIVNFVGKYGTDNISELFKYNFDVTKNIVNSVIENNFFLKKILLIGSAAEYGISDVDYIMESANLNPVNFYGLSKKIQSQFAIDSYNIKKIPINVARTFNLTGEGISENLLPGKFKKIIFKAENNTNIEMKNLSSIRDYIEVEKAVEMYWKILIDGMPGEVYNVCSGKGTTIRDMLIKLINDSGKKINIIETDEIYSNTDVDKIIGSNKKIMQLMS